MIIFTVLLAILGILAIALIVAALTGGIAILGLFGDVIVFVLIIVLIVKFIRRKKNK